MNKSAVALPLILLVLNGCVSVRVGTGEESSALRMKGLANGYGSLNGIRPYDGTFFELGVLKDSRRSHEFEVVSVDLWPFCGLGVGLAGARVQVLFLDIGVGVLAYDPRPPTWDLGLAEDGDENAHEAGKQEKAEETPAEEAS